jgi:predicted enzyme related to lactoylglutathione lyase
MIQGMHGMVFTTEPEATRAFFRDKLKLPYMDAGQGWLVFDLPSAETACHPVGEPSGGGQPHGTWEFAFYCDDIQATVAELKGRGVEFTSEIKDEGYGLVTHIKAPGGLTVMLYQRLYR